MIYKNAIQISKKIKAACMSVCVLLLITFIGCSSTPQPTAVSSEDKKVDYSFENDGRDLNAPFLSSTYTFTESYQVPAVSLNNQCDLKTALKRQRAYVLKKQMSERKTIDNLSFSRADQLQVLNQIEAWLNNPQQRFPQFNAYKIAGKDMRGNVQFTGYFSPKMMVRRQANAQYRYPIYALPKKGSIPLVDGKLPSRDQIDFENALAGQGLELAYAENLVDPFFMQIQGSGVVEFEDTGEVLTFAYAGKNGHGYHSIGRYLVEQGYLTPEEVSLDTIKVWLKNNPRQVREVFALNPSYVFFRESRELPTGASGQPVSAFCSVAVDPKFIPYGSTLLIKRPVLDSSGNLIRHENSIFFAQDRGGAIKGTGRVDIYTGIGDFAKQQASALKHYGALWMLLPQ